MRKGILAFCTRMVLLGIVTMACTPDKKMTITEQDMVISWAEMTLYVTQFTPANSPTYASRAVGYIGLTMYESVVTGYPDYQSLASQLHDMPTLDVPEPGKEYNWPLSFNAAQATILRGIYNQTSDENKAKIDSLEMYFEKYFSGQANGNDEVERSIAYGRSIATTIFEWSKSDGGHRGYLKNFDKEFEHLVRPGAWKPPLYSQSVSHHPLHPYWGKNRTFLKENFNLPLPQMIPYDTLPDSPYYQQFLSVYETDLGLTQEQKEIAIWWGDDPDETFTPPGHSFYLANLAVKKEKPGLIKCAETYARVGLAVADAFINCWKWKYHFFSERPNTYIPQFIDPEWVSFWPDPPFPAFPSGHAIQAAASTTVLADMYGEKFAFTDSSHVGRPRDEIRDVDFKARSFTTFWGVAQETADSRFYGGIHTPQDNNIGLEEGARIAGNVNKLIWKKSGNAIQ